MSAEEGTIRAATSVVTTQIKDGMILGLGSGSAVAKFAKALGERIARGELKDIHAVPSSMQAWLLAKENSIPLVTDSAHCPALIDVAVDGADQISLPTRSMIKGGGGALLREKIILSSSKASFILGDYNKLKEKLERSVPIEVVQFALGAVENKLREDYGVQPELRKLEKGYPFFTESGNVILDSKFSSPIIDPARLEVSLKSIPGVVEVGIFNCKIEKFYIANQGGSFEVR